MNSHARGMTLVEMLVAIAVAAILAATAAPQFTEYVANARLVTQTNDWVAAANVARSEAIKRAQPVTLQSVSGNVNWQAGWRVVLTSTAEDLRVQEALRGGNTLTADAAGIQFQGTGFPTGTISLLLCRPESGKEGRRVAVAASGRVSVVTEVCP